MTVSECLTWHRSLQKLCVSVTKIFFGPGDVSWSLGAALVEGENIWLDAATSRIINLTPLKIISSPIFVLLLFILSIFHCSQVRLPMLGKKSVASGASSLPYIHPKPRSD